MANESKKSLAGAIGALIGTIVLAAACAVAGWVGSGIWSGFVQKKKAAAMAAMAKPNLATVAVTNAELRVYNLPERFVAHATAEQEVDLLPQVDGYIKEIFFKDGDVVKAGQLLYQLDDERYQAVANQRRADLGAAEALLESAKTEAQRTERYWDRMKAADERGITQKERDDAEAGYEKARAIVEQCKASVAQAKANLVVAEYDVKRTKVYAPISGQCSESYANVGDYVAPSKGALAHIVQIDPVYVRFPMTDRAYVGWRLAVQKGTAPDYRLRLILADGSEYDKQGKWAFDANEMSKETATIEMALLFPNPDRILVPNSYVTLLADFKTPPKMLSIPQQCLIELSGGNQGVWVVRDDMTVEQRPVTVKEAYEGWVPVVSGLKAGEKIVLSGVGKLATGVKVQVSTPTANDDVVKNFQPPIKD